MSHDVSSSGTGASNEQIDESCRRWWNEPPAQHHTSTWDEVRENTVGESRIRLHGRIAQFLAPPTHRIVAVDDLRNLLTLHDELAEMTFMGPSMDACAFLDRIRALIGGE